MEATGILLSTCFMAKIALLRSSSSSLMPPLRTINKLCRVGAQALSREPQRSHGCDPLSHFTIFGISGTPCGCHPERAFQMPRRPLGCQTNPLAPGPVCAVSSAAEQRKGSCPAAARPGSSEEQLVHELCRARSRRCGRGSALCLLACHPQ